MLRYKDSIRLTAKEKRRLESLTGTKIKITSVNQLNQHIDQAIGQYTGEAPEERLLRHILKLQKIT